MCTVTIAPAGEHNFILTSNRDEAPNRVSITPDFYTINTARGLFPKDEQSDGTWIGVSDKNRVVCLLNGGFTIHKRKLNYRLSRGVVVKHFMGCDDVVETVNAYNFEAIEPFTLVVADWNAGLRFFELVWDGKDKHFIELPLEPKIWSSSTLYNPQMQKERLQWFLDFESEKVLTSKALLEFHKTAGESNKDYGVIMDRGVVKTTSITQIRKHDDLVELQYENLINGTKAIKFLEFSQVING